MYLIFSPFWVITSQIWILCRLIGSHKVHRRGVLTFSHRDATVRLVFQYKVEKITICAILHGKAEILNFAPKNLENLVRRRLWSTKCQAMIQDLFHGEYHNRKPLFRTLSPK